MAGAAGFEPTHGRIKTCCLTAWRRPCSSGQRLRKDRCENGAQFINIRFVWEARDEIFFVLKQPLIIFPRKHSVSLPCITVCTRPAAIHALAKTSFADTERIPR